MKCIDCNNKIGNVAYTYLNKMLIHVKCIKKQLEVQKTLQILKIGWLIGQYKIYINFDDYLKDINETLENINK